MKAVLFFVVAGLICIPQKKERYYLSFIFSKVNISIYGIDFGCLG